MKVKNGDIWRANPGLDSLKSQDLPVKTSYWLRRLNIVLQPHLQALVAERDRLVAQFGERQGSGFILERRTPGMERFVAEFGPLLDVEVELDLPFCPVVLPVSYLGLDGKEHPLILSQQDLEGLDLFVTFPELLDVPQNGTEEAPLQVVK